MEINENSETTRGLDSSPSENLLIFGHRDIFEETLDETFQLRDVRGIGAQMDAPAREKMLRLSIELLRDWSGQDFGYDLDAYAAWFNAHRHDWKDYSVGEQDSNTYRI